MMSATILDAKTFCKSIGISFDDVKVLARIEPEEHRSKNAGSVTTELISTLGLVKIIAT